MTLVRQLVLLLIMSTVGVLGVLPKVRQQEIAEITPTIATQGKTYDNNEECCAAVHAIDKDLSTGAVTKTDNGGGWLKLEFHKTYFIHKVVIYYRFYNNWYNPSVWCVQSVANFNACVDNDNNVDVSVYQGEVQQKSCGTLQLTYGLEQSDQIYTLLCNIEGDTVILSKNTGVIAVYEVAVTMTEREEEIAEITPTIATQGKTYNNNEELYAAAHAIDKDLSTGAVTTSDNGAGWLKLEFDKTYFIHKVVIYYRFYNNWYNPSYGCAESEANFMACVDRNNNVDVSVYQGEVKQKSCGTLQLTYGLEQSDQIYTLLCNIEGDTLILSKNTGTIAVYEVAVTKTVYKDRQQEIAEITPTIATQGNTLNNNEECCAAVHAMDKDLSTGAATTTDNGAGWLKLVFDKTYFIHKVVIYYRFYTNWYFPSVWCVQRVAIFKACVNNDNNVDVSVYQGEVKQKSCGTLQLTYGLEQSDQIYTLICNIEGDTLILSKNTGNIVVFEVAVTKTECESFDTTKFPGLESPELPVFPGTILTVKCEKPARFAIISGDKTLTCVQGSTFNFSLIPTCALVGKCTL
ncbi:hypothetical protein ACHWQZ_G005274 [Mnemiopsis leidyi]